MDILNKRMIKALSNNEDYINFIGALDSKELLEIVKEYNNLDPWSKFYFRSIGQTFMLCIHPDVCEYIVENYIEVLYNDLKDLRMAYIPWKIRMIKEKSERDRPIVSDIILKFIGVSDIINIIWNYTPIFRGEFPYGKKEIDFDKTYIKFY